MDHAAVMPRLMESNLRLLFQDTDPQIRAEGIYGRNGTRKDAIRVPPVRLDTAVARVQRTREDEFHHNVRVINHIDSGIDLILIGFDREQVVRAPVQDLLAELPMTVAGIPGEHPTLPDQLGDHPRGHRQFCLRFVLSRLKRFLCQDYAVLLTEGGEHMDHPLSLFELAPPPAAPYRQRSLPAPRAPDPLTIEDLPEDGGHGPGIELAEQRVQGRLAWGSARLEAELLE